MHFNIYSILLFQAFCHRRHRAHEGMCAINIKQMYINIRVCEEHQSSALLILPFAKWCSCMLRTRGCRIYTTFMCIVYNNNNNDRHHDYIYTPICKCHIHFNASHRQQICHFKHMCARRARNREQSFRASRCIAHRKHTTSSSGNLYIPTL